MGEERPVSIVAGRELDEQAPAPGMGKGPYVADTCTVTQEGRYLVVELPG